MFVLLAKQHGVPCHRWCVSLPKFLSKQPKRAWGNGILILTASASATSANVIKRCVGCQSSKSTTKCCLHHPTKVPKAMAHFHRSSLSKEWKTRASRQRLLRYGSWAQNCQVFDRFEMAPNSRLTAAMACLFAIAWHCLAVLRWCKNLHHSFPSSACLSISATKCHRKLFDSGNLPRSKWDPDVVCDGVPAGERVAWCVKNLGLSSEESRRSADAFCKVVWKSKLLTVNFNSRQRVMREFCANFGERAGITAAAWRAVARAFFVAHQVVVNTCISTIAPLCISAVWDFTFPVCQRLASEVKMWEIFPEADDGSLIWSDEFDYTGPSYCKFCRQLLVVHWYELWHVVLIALWQVHLIHPNGPVRLETMAGAMASCKPTQRIQAMYGFPMELCTSRPRGNLWDSGATHPPGWLQRGRPIGNMVALKSGWGHHQVVVPGRPLGCYQQTRNTVIGRCVGRLTSWSMWGWMLVESMEPSILRCATTRKEPKLGTFCLSTWSNGTLMVWHGHMIAWTFSMMAIVT